MATDDIELPAPDAILHEDGYYTVPDRETRLGWRETVFTAATVRRLIAEHVAAAVAAERERAAQVAEGGAFLHADSPAARFGRECAAAIRRGGPAVPRAEAPPAPAQPEAEQGADERDANRYRLMRDRSSCILRQTGPEAFEASFHFAAPPGGLELDHDDMGEELDALVDAAMRAEGDGQC